MIYFFEVLLAAAVCGQRQAVEHSSLDHVDRRLVDFYKQQVNVDRQVDQATPDLQSQFEWIPGLGRVSIGVLLGRGASSLVYAVQGNANLALKYQSNCYSMNEIHPLIKDNFFGTLAFQSGVSMERFFVSPPAHLPEQRNAKTMFSGDQAFLMQCSRKGGTIRYMLMQRVDGCLGVIGPKRPGSVRLSMKVGMMLMNMLNTLYTDYGIGHGDIHAGNVCFLRVNNEKPKLILIDFEQSFFVRPQCTWQGSPHANPALSPWGIAGFRTNARDDVFNAIFTAADVMFDGSPWSHAQKLAAANEVSDLINWKFHSDFFSYPTDQIAHDPSLSKPDQVQAIRIHISRILFKVRELANPKIPIDLAWFQNEFKAALAWAYA